MEMKSWFWRHPSRWRKRYSQGSKNETTVQGQRIQKVQVQGFSKSSVERNTNKGRVSPSTFSSHDICTQGAGAIAERYSSSSEWSDDQNWKARSTGSIHEHACRGLLRCKPGEISHPILVGEVSNLYKTPKPSPSRLAIDLHRCSRNEAFEKLDYGLPVWVDTATKGEYPWVIRRRHLWRRQPNSVQANRYVVNI